MLPDDELRVPVSSAILVLVVIDMASVFPWERQLTESGYYCIYMLLLDKAQVSFLARHGDFMMVAL
jgi:hypothetical protein